MITIKKKVVKSVTAENLMPNKGYTLKNVVSKAVYIPFYREHDRWHAILFRHGENAKYAAILLCDKSEFVEVDYELNFTAEI